MLRNTFNWKSSCIWNLLWNRYWYGLLKIKSFCNITFLYNKMRWKRWTGTLDINHSDKTRIPACVYPGFSFGTLNHMLLSYPNAFFPICICLLIIATHCVKISWKYRLYGFTWDHSHRIEDNISQNKCSVNMDWKFMENKFKRKVILVCIFKRFLFKRHKKKGTRTRTIFHLVHCSNDCNISVWARLKPQSRNSTRVRPCPRKSRDSSSWAMMHWIRMRMSQEVA